jgi:hypothetical protein
MTQNPMHRPSQRDVSTLDRTSDAYRQELAEWAETDAEIHELIEAADNERYAASDRAFAALKDGEL